MLANSRSVMSSGKPTMKTVVISSALRAGAPTPAVLATLLVDRAAAAAAEEVQVETGVTIAAAVADGGGDGAGIASACAWSLQLHHAAWTEVARIWEDRAYLTGAARWRARTEVVMSNAARITAQLR